MKHIALFVVLTISANVPMIFGQSDPISDDMIRDSIQRSWLRASEVERVGHTCNYRIRFDSAVSGEKPTSSVHTGKLAINGKMQSFVTEGVVYGRNKHYSFLIAKDSSKSDWKLTAMSTHPDDKVDLVATGSSDNHLLIHPLTGYFGSSCHELWTQGRLKLKQFERQSTGLVKAEFEARIPLGKREDHFRGTMLLDPNKHWLIVESQITTPHGIDQSSTGWLRRNLRVRKDDPEFVVCNEIETSFTRSGGSQTIKVEFTSHNWESPADEDFRLSKYGLPEPLDAPKVPQNRNWIWITALGVCSFGFGLALLVRSRRRRTNSH